MIGGDAMRSGPEAELAIDEPVNCDRIRIGQRGFARVIAGIDEPNRRVESHQKRAAREQVGLLPKIRLTREDYRRAAKLHGPAFDLIRPEPERVIKSISIKAS